MAEQREGALTASTLRVPNAAGLSRDENRILKGMKHCEPSLSWPFHRIAELSGVSDGNNVRKAVRSLTRKGLAEYRNDLPGSGYRLTRSGRGA